MLKDHPGHRWRSLPSVFTGKSATVGKHRTRDGICLLPGTLVYAVASARCVHVQLTDHANSYDSLGNYGRHIVLEFNEGEGPGYQPKIPLDTQKFYAFSHLDDVYVAEGQEVHIGDVIGRTGRSGHGAARLPIDQAHLHFEIRTIPATGRGLGQHIDPGWFLPQPAAENQNFPSPSDWYTPKR